MDVKVFNESGLGYWLDGFGCLRAEGGYSQSSPGHVVCLQGGGTSSTGQPGGDGWSESGMSYTLNTIDRHGICYGLSRSMLKGGMNGGGIPIEKELQPTITANGCGGVSYPEITGALCANSHPGSYTGQDAFNDMLPVIKNGRKYVVRRLTPLECSRLQGFPDWWTDGSDGSDSAIYKMWGNGIALPCAADVIGRLAKELEKDESVRDV